MNSPNSHDPLPGALAAWQIAPRRNPRFRAEVRARIDATRRPSAWSAYLRTHGALVAAALVGAVALGGWRGHEQARERGAQARAALVADYVHGLDARWMRAP